MRVFRFEPTLFAARAEAQEALQAGGFEWWVDYSNIDLLHDVYGIEVCGISREEAAFGIERILRKVFPKWNYSYVVQHDPSDVEAGWKAVAYRDPEPPDTLDFKQ